MYRVQPLFAGIGNCARGGVCKGRNDLPDCILPPGSKGAAHVMDDEIPQASGPGANRFKGYMEQSDVYRIIAGVLTLGNSQIQP